jgi:hypothetical protein
MYEHLLEKSQLPSLRLRRLLSMAIEVFKIINKQTPVYLHDLVTIKKSSYSFSYNVQLSTYQELTPPGMVCIHWDMVQQNCGTNFQMTCVRE